MMVIVDKAEEFYRHHADELLRFATALVGPSGSEDLFANVILKLLPSAGFQAAEHQRAYAFRAVLNEARASHRSTQRRLAREIKAVRPDGYEPHQLHSEVVEALRKLSVQQRAVVYLSYWDDLPLAEVAVAVGIPLRTCERELSAARSRLKDLLK